MRFIQKFHQFEKLLELFQDAAFVKAFLTFISMWKDGFFFSENTHVDSDGTRWGFYRLHHKTERPENDLYDIDFQFTKTGPGGSYFHARGDDYRFDFDEDQKVTKIEKKLWEIRHEPKQQVDQKKLVAQRICKMNDIASHDNVDFEFLIKFAKRFPGVMKSVMKEYEAHPDGRFGDTLLIFCSNVKAGSIEI